ncbi:HdeD family acid-resistance protein [Propionibacterium sp.]|uniref:HdeD family acid-resistance protein n=1 Tax=Propionibacterium sp. TaxID=1977903 RepID=UPI0039ECAC84
MSEKSSPDTFERMVALTNTVRVVFFISGLITAVVGVLLLIWPGLSPQLAAAHIAIYALPAGVISVALGLFARRIAGWRRGGYAVIGVLLVIVCIVALWGVDTDGSNVSTFLGIVAGIVWILQGIFAVAQTDRSKDTLWSIIFGVVSVLAGIAVLISPLWGRQGVWISFGVALLVLGLAQIVQGLNIGDWTYDPKRKQAPAAESRPASVKPSAKAESAPKPKSAGKPKATDQKLPQSKNAGATTAATGPTAATDPAVAAPMPVKSTGSELTPDFLKTDTAGSAEAKPGDAPRDDIAGQAPVGEEKPHTGADNSVTGPEDDAKMKKGWRRH